MQLKTAGCFLFAAFCGVGCGDDADPAASADTFQQQVTQGSSLYAGRCAACHGSSGEGTADAPPLVGLDDGALPREPRPGAARTSQFVTAADVAEFVVTAMPPPPAARLNTEQALAILAFALSANGLTLEQKLTLENADGVVIPR